MRLLIRSTGFIGDILFSSSVAKKLKEQYGVETIVDYLIPLIQPQLLLENNPYIDNVYVEQLPFSPFGIYGDVITMPEGNQAFPMTVLYQQHANILNATREYEVYTLEQYDEAYKQMFANRKKKIIGWQTNWEWKSYQCTPDLLSKRIGAPHRNIAKVIEELNGYDEFLLIPCGYDRNVQQRDPIAYDALSFAKTASLIKACDWFIGSEGGLTNLSCAVGTKTIITSDFIAQNYWRNGHVKQYELPMMGPVVYFPSGGHSHLHPCISDDDLAAKIRSIVNNNTVEVFDWHTRFQDYV